jgi:penicillin-binding protein 1A
VRFRYGGYGQGAYAALPIWARYMQKIYRDPLYGYSKELSFQIPENVIQELDCGDYLESSDELKREKRRRTIRNFFRFDRRKRRNN